MNSNKTLPEKLRLPVSAAVITVSVGLAAVLRALGFMSLPQVAILGGVLVLIGLLMVEFFYRIAVSGWRESEQRHRGLAALRKSSLSISSSLNLDEVLQSILACTVELAKVKMINIMLIDQDTRTLIMRAHIGQPPDWAEAVQRNPIPVGKSLTGWVAEKGEVLQVRDAASDPRLLYADFAKRYGLSSYLGIPLKFRERVIGVLNLHTSEPRRFAAEQIEVLCALADHAAVALENARLHGEAERKGAEAAALAEISKDLSSSFDLSDVLDKLAAHAQQITQSDLAYIGLSDPEEQVVSVEASVGYRTEFHEHQKVERHKGTGGLVLETKKPFLTDDYLNDLRFPHEPSYDELAKKEGIISQLIVPILKEERVLGLMWVANRRPLPFTFQDQGLLQALASQAAIAIENARLYGEIRQRAQELEEKNRQLLATQEQLIKAQRLAAIGELGLAVAHEINNPLATLLLQLEFISRESQNLPSELQTSLKIMEQMIWRMKGVVDRLQDIRSEETREVAEGLKMMDLRAEAGLFEQ